MAKQIQYHKTFVSTKYNIPKMLLFAKEAELRNAFLIKNDGKGLAQVIQAGTNWTQGGCKRSETKGWIHYIFLLHNES